MTQINKYLNHTRRHASTTSSLVFFIFGLLVGQQSWKISRDSSLTTFPIPVLSDRQLLFPSTISSLQINIGPNISPILPRKSDDTIGVLVVEANIGIANMLREKYQKNKFPYQFFVISAAVADPSRVGLSNFHFYNNAGQSSSLSIVNPHKNHAMFEDRARFNPSEQYGPGPTAVDFVPTITLETILRSIPTNITIELLKIDAQGHDLSIIKSSSPKTLRRVPRILSEVFLSRAEHIYSNVSNGYVETISYMTSIGYRLANPPGNPKYGHYLDADWRIT